MSETDIWTVTRLNRAAKQMLENHLPRLWLEGELTNFKSYASGHWYFTLKDDASQVQGVMFRGNNQQVNFRPEDGQQIRILGDVSLYVRNGKFQIIARKMQPAGQGALLAQLEKLKQKLRAEGVFAAERKRPLPSVPQKLGVITSANGAAFHDILRVLERRYPQLPVILYPASVQGPNAAAELRQALATAIKRHECDVLIIGRGGGSLENLFAFNDESLTRAVADCPIPIVSSVGHEVDFSLTDFAADVRAATPSAAAEQVAPDMNEYRQQIAQYASRLSKGMQRQLRWWQERQTQLDRRLLSPEKLLQQQAQRLDDNDERLHRALDWQKHRYREKLSHLEHRLTAQRPDRQLTHLKQQLHSQRQQLRQLLTHQQTRLDHRKKYCQQLTYRLQMAAPENLLKRGYTLTYLDETGKRVNATDKLPAGTRLITQLASNRRVYSEVVERSDK